MYFKIFISAIIILFSANPGYSQIQGTFNTNITIPDGISLLDIEPSTNDFILEFTAPNDPGNPLIEPVNDSNWINYTVTAPLGGPNKNITVQISGPTYIPELKIYLTASAYIGTGAGAFGTPTGLIELSTIAQTIVSGIGGAYTGDGISNGHKLEYEVYISDYSLFEMPLIPSSNILFTLSY